MKRKSHFLLSLLDPSPLLAEIHNKTYFKPLLKELKDYTPYSSIFLNKVSKKDAPTYYDIIKNPMDLGTMSKKLAMYDTKSFFDDLDLIWDNCFYFNAQSPFFIDCAQKMKIKTESLKEFYFGEENIEWEQFSELTEICKVKVKPGNTSSGCCIVSTNKKSQENNTPVPIRYDIIARNAIRIFVAKVLNTCGFECCSKAALNVLIDVFSSYLLNRIFHMYYITKGIS